MAGTGERKRGGGGGPGLGLYRGTVRGVGVECLGFRVAGANVRKAGVGV